MKKKQTYNICVLFSWHKW